MLSNAGKQFSKVLLVVFILCIGIAAFWYGWGGPHYQEQALDASEQLLLKTYLQQQNEYFDAHKTFDLQLHTTELYSRNAKIRIGFSGDTKELSDCCVDCQISGNHFKVAAVGSTFWGGPKCLVAESDGKSQ